MYIIMRRQLFFVILVTSILEKLDLRNILQKELKYIEGYESNSSHIQTTQCFTKLKSDENLEPLSLKVNEKLTTILNDIRKNKERTIFDSLRREKHCKKSKNHYPMMIRNSEKNINTANVKETSINKDRNLDEISSLLNLSSDSDDNFTLVTNVEKVKLKRKEKNSKISTKLKIKKKKQNETKEYSEIIGKNTNLISTENNLLHLLSLNNNANFDSNNDEKVNVNNQNKKKYSPFCSESIIAEETSHKNNSEFLQGENFVFRNKKLSESVLTKLKSFAHSSTIEQEMVNCSNIINNSLVECNTDLNSEPIKNNDHIDEEVIFEQTLSDHFVSEKSKISDSFNFTKDGAISNLKENNQNIQRTQNLFKSTSIFSMCTNDDDDDDLRVLDDIL